MSTQAIEIPSIPKETARAARAVFSHSNFYIRLGEQLETILDGNQIKSITGEEKTSWVEKASLPLITFFQFTEGLTDEQAVDAVRTRIDWKFALHLPVNTLPFHQSILCQFRQKVIKTPVSQCEFQKLADQLIAFDPPRPHTHQDFEILALLSSICSINIMDRALKALYAALGALASRSPEWLLQIAQPHWYWRFNHLLPYTSPVSSMSHPEISMEKLGADIHHLLEEVHGSNLGETNELKEIKTLNSIWEQQFEKGDAVLSAQSGTPIPINCDACIYGAA